MGGSDFPPAARGRDGRLLPGNPRRAFGSRDRQRLARAILKDGEGGVDGLPTRVRRCCLPQSIGRVARLAAKVGGMGGVELERARGEAGEAALASGLCGAALDTARRGSRVGRPAGRSGGAMSRAPLFAVALRCGLRPAVEGPGAARGD
jgi:hypothetical protein